MVKLHFLWIYVYSEHLNLESLDLRGVWLRNSSRDSFVTGIRKLRYLRKLSIPYVANDAVLAALAKNCPDLRHLGRTLFSNAVIFTTRT